MKIKSLEVTKSEHLFLFVKKNITLLQNHEYDNQTFQENLQEAIEENARLNLLRKVFKFMSILTSWRSETRREICSI